MKLSQKQIDSIIKFVKQEPRNVQEISLMIKKSWVTTKSYLDQISQNTGLISIKTFRKGSHGALKIVYYNFKDLPTGEEVKEDLFSEIISKRKKEEFDFFEIFQYAQDNQKKLYFRNDSKKDSSKSKLSDYLLQTKNKILFFSGNLSFINQKENNIKILDILEDLLKQKINIKIICRITPSTLNNLSKIQPLLSKYPNSIEIKHRYHPLRGFIIDDKIARFNCFEYSKDYKPNELDKSLNIVYEIYDKEWLLWLQKVFWKIFQSSIDYNIRLKQFRKFL